MPEFSLFAGTSNPALANSVASLLGRRVAACSCLRFPDGELSVVLDESVRGRSVFILQSTAPPVTENVFQLLQFIDACRRGAAARITAIVPYFGYSRSDKRHGRREPITASMLATLFQAVGLDDLVSLDLHAVQIEGFFRLPVDHLTAVPILCQELQSRLRPGTVIVSPDEGRVKMAGQYAERLGLEVAVLHKQRQSGTETSILNVVGEVRDRPCLIVDDMISTGGTIANATAALLTAGARPDIRVAATHGVLVKGARENLSHPAIREVYITDTIMPPEPLWPNLSIISIAALLASVIQRLATDQPVAELLTRPVFITPTVERRKRRIEHEKFVS